MMGKSGVRGIGVVSVLATLSILAGTMGTAADPAEPVSPGIPVVDSGLRISSAFMPAPIAGGASGAAYMVIENRSEMDDWLLAVRSADAGRAQLHNHVETDDGIVMMRPLENGVPVPAGGTVTFARGGMHVMLMRLKHRFNPGDTLKLTLVFRSAGDIPIELPVVPR
ncbi:MAG: copper chaperone PCu(A)C [Paracoccaceae bacterium]|nr:copper chaperone PCu(A)C [Paracoccaceae bacterium]MDE2912706.1 copper chaperone PCu(A)C [Paracoccaceae bacterium]